MANPLHFLVLLPLVIAPTLQQCDGGDDDATPFDDTPTEFVDCSDQTKLLWAYDFSVMPPAMEQVQATCRLEGGFTYIYVADDQWGTNVTAEDVEAVLSVFEHTTPEGSINPAWGLYQNDVTVFGQPPDEFDNDPKIHLFFYGMADYVNDEGVVYRFDGYFGSMDQYSEEEIQRQTFGRYHSNEIEIVYINSQIRPITDELTISVTGHEFQHLIAWNYDEDEETWMSEALAEVAMIINGYYTDYAWVEDYADWSGYPMVYTGSVNYGAALLWGMYLYEQVDQDFMFHVQDEDLDGIDGLNRALQTYDSSETFEGLYRDWVVANVVNEPDTGRYGYQFGPLPDFARVALLAESEDGHDGETYAYGVDYIDIVLGGGLLQGVVELQTDDPNFGLGLLIRFEAGVMVDVTPLVADAPGGVARADLTGATPDTTWTLAVTYENPDAVYSGEMMSYGVTLR